MQCLQHRVYLAADGGRLCRPLVIADDEGKSRIKQHHIEDFIVSLSYAFHLRNKSIL